MTFKEDFPTISKIHPYDNTYCEDDILKSCFDKEKIIEILYKYPIGADMRELIIKELGYETKI